MGLDSEDLVVAGERFVRPSAAISHGPKLHNVVDDVVEVRRAGSHLDRRRHAGVWDEVISADAEL